MRRFVLGWEKLGLRKRHDHDTAADAD